MEIQKAAAYREDVVALLLAEKLPVTDLPPTLDNFWVMADSGRVTGTIGLELYGHYALLRSVAVAPGHRSMGIAGQLLWRAERAAQANDIKAIYLLTDTAAAYFAGKGYQTIGRADVPAEVQASAEFSHLCPASATVMFKNL